MSEDDGQNIPYISDVGASPLKPLFITGCVVTTVLLDAGFAADRWLRHRGRLAPNTTLREKVLSGLCIACALVGTAGLVLLSVFDTVHHPRLHDVFLGLFIGGYLFSSVFVCWEFRLLHTHTRRLSGGRGPRHRVLRASFWLKLVFIVVELALTIAFLAANHERRRNAGAVLEWIIGFIFSFYIFSFAIDLWPAGKPASTDFERGGVVPRLSHDVPYANEKERF